MTSLRPFLGSVRLADALYETLRSHTYEAHVGAEGYYLLCLCTWRTDLLPCGALPEDHLRRMLVHLENALHAASVGALRDLVVRRVEAEDLLAGRRGSSQA